MNIQYKRSEPFWATQWMLKWICKDEGKEIQTKWASVVLIPFISVKLAKQNILVNYYTWYFLQTLLFGEQNKNTWFSPSRKQNPTKLSPSSFSHFFKTQMLVLKLFYVCFQRHLLKCWRTLLTIKIRKVPFPFGLELRWNEEWLPPSRKFVHFMCAS